MIPVRAPHSDCEDNARFKIVSFGPKLIVDSCDSRKEPARLPHDAFAGPINRTSDGHPTLTPRQWHDDRAVALRCVNFIPETYHWLFVSFQYLSSGDVSNTTTQCELIWTQFSLLMEAV